MKKFSVGENVDFDRLKTILVNSGFQSKSNPLFQVVDGLINGAQLFRKSLFDVVKKTDKISLTEQIEGKLLPKNGGTKTDQYDPSPMQLISNLSGAGVDYLYYIHTGSFVTVFGRFQLLPTAIGVNTELGFELPIISYFDFKYECAGAAASPEVNQSGAVLADVGNNRAKLQFLAVTNVQFDMYFNFGYKIIEK
ncbi:MAG: hypothetical protein EHM34_09725 [Nitrosopumilales archaeon]|nr:MAG: hypothetical protein EHM34_09725 [Nitrosopumilales archaeon]